MRLCLASLHPRALSGQIDSLAGLGKALRDRGHDVRLVAPFDTSRLLEDPLTQVDTGPAGLLGGARRMLAAMPRIVQAAAGSDLVHLALPTPAFGWVGDVIQSAADAPVLVSYEGHLAAAAEALAWRNLVRGPKSWLALWGVNNGLFARLGGHRCCHYIVSTEFQRRELKALGLDPARTSVIPNVVDKDKLRRRPGPAARLEFGLPDKRRLVGYIGHFNQVKGIDVLGQAFVELAKADTEVELALAWSGQGSAGQMKRLLAPFADRVHWLGKVDVGLFLSAIDVLALPYRSTAGQAALPALVIEALHMSRPLVTTRLPLLEEVLEDGETAMLTPSEDAESLAASLGILSGDRELMRHMAAAQLEASWSYTPAHLAARYEELYCSLLPSAAPIRRREVAA